MVGGVVEPRSAFDACVVRVGAGDEAECPYGIPFPVFANVAMPPVYFVRNQFTLRIAVYPLVRIPGVGHKAACRLEYFHQAVQVGGCSGAYGSYYKELEEVMPSAGVKGQ